MVQFLESGDVWRPSNYEKNFEGPLLLRTALALSRNLCTIRVVQQMGVQKVIERAKDLELEPHFPEVLSVSLGAVAVTPLNMTQAYTAFANGGMVSKARFILSVKNFWNETIYESQPDLRDAISPAERLCDVLPAQRSGERGHGDESQSARTARRGQNRDQQRLEGRVVHRLLRRIS